MKIIYVLFLNKTPLGAYEREDQANEEKEKKEKFYQEQIKIEPIAYYEDIEK